MNIILKGISKTFTQRTWRTILGLRKPGKVKALKNVSLSISSGEIFGLLGPNGAGKTTLIKILATLILPDSGAASVGDYDLVGQPEKVRHLIGFVNSNERSFYWRLTGRQNMHFFASLWNLRDPEKTRRIEMLFDLVGLSEKADTLFMKYSSGQQQRLSLARALLSDPKILLMDEPTQSLDPMAASEIRKFAREELAAKRGKTILWCTHNLQEAREVCDRLAVIHQGNVMATGTLRSMQSLMPPENRYRLKIATQPFDVLRNIGISPARISQNNGMMEFEIREKEENIPALLNRLFQENIAVFACHRQEQALEDVFKKIVQSDTDEHRQSQI